MRKRKSATLRKTDPEYWKNLITKKLKEVGANAAYKALNIFTLGNLSKAIKDVYNDKYVENIKKQKDLNKIAIGIYEKYPEVKSEIKEKTKNAKLDNREDTNKSTKLDESTIKFDCLFSGDDGKELVKIAKDINDRTIEAAKYIKDKEDDLDKDLKSIGLTSLSDEDKKTYGPAISGMIAQGKSKEEILKELKKLKNESLKIYNDKLMLIESNNKLLKENKLVLTEDFKQQLLIESAYLTEGFFDFAKGIFGKEARDFVSKSVNYSNETPFGYDEYTSIWHEIREPVIVGAKIGNIAAAWAPVIAYVGLSLMDKYKRQIRNTVSSQFKKFKNKKGVIAEMEFNTDPAENKKGYNLQFNIQDFKWRCLNRKNILHYPSKELLKTALDSKFGKQFREYCKNAWDPIFKQNEDEYSVFMSIVSEDKKILNLKKDSIKFLKDMGENYEKIEKDCLSDSYKFDERPRGA